MFVLQMMHFYSISLTFKAINLRYTYQNFVSARYTGDGIKMAVGILTPALVSTLFNCLPIGLLFSLGALCTAIPDTPGPLHHRLNSMLATLLLIGLVAVLVTLFNLSKVITCFIILSGGFLFSMLNIFGNRLSAIGMAALLILILSLEPSHSNISAPLRGAYIMAGGMCYMLLSLLLSSVRPYKVLQQSLGDFADEVAAYLQIRSGLYAADMDFDKTYEALLQQQIKVQTTQAMLSEIIFKTRTLVKESTKKGRVLLKLYVDITDLFEAIMSSFPDFKKLHLDFDETGLLQDLQVHISNIATELSHAALAIRSGTHAYKNAANIKSMQAIRDKFQSLRQTMMQPANVESFVNLGRIVSSIGLLTENISNLHYYTGYKRKVKQIAHDELMANYASENSISPALFFESLNMSSSIFRHALRMSFTLVAGYLLALAFNIGHSYWILLTIAVILKPAYSLTKQRNKDRLLGTIIGILVGAGILFITQSTHLLLSIMICFMIPCYIFLRQNYFVSVLFMTPYLVIFFFLLYPQSIEVMLRDRVLDTVIGSAIAFAASLFFAPAWEHQSILELLSETAKTQQKYFAVVGTAFLPTVQFNSREAQSARRDMLAALANSSDAFTRMLSEPKRFQLGADMIHRYVVLSHILSAHTSSLSFYLKNNFTKFRAVELQPVIDTINIRLNNAFLQLNHKEKMPEAYTDDAFEALNRSAEELLQLRRNELANRQLETETKNLLVESKSVIDQFKRINKLAVDIEKLSGQIGHIL